jgi:hypothetical protein
MEAAGGTKGNSNLPSYLATIGPIRMLAEAWAALVDFTDNVQ